MWVQEGGDCKEVDEETRQSNTWFSRFYKPKKKQTITTIGIPMRKPEPIIPKKQPVVEIKSPEKIVAEEKEKEASESPKTSSVPMSPAQFLQNIEKSKESDPDQGDGVDKTYHNPVPFTINNDPMTCSDHDQDEDAELHKVDNVDHIDDIDGGHDIDDTEYDGKEIDLTIIGKKLEMLDSIPDFFKVDDQDQQDMDLDIVMRDYTESNNEDTEISETNKEDQDSGFDDTSNTAYIDNYTFHGLDIKTWTEWDKCMGFTQKNGLLVIELYSTMFGPSNVMYSMIADILQKKQRNKVRFVRMNINKFSQIDEIKEVITDYRFYTASPIPMYIFIKNGVKMDKLQGIRVREFEKLIDKYLQNEMERPQSAQTSETKKYRSILTERPQSAYLPSKDVDNVDKENQSQRGNVENIRNLIKNLDVSPKRQATKLNKFSIGKSCGTNTQQIM